MEAVLFIGIPASGKSTFYLRRFLDTHVRINLDMLKTRRRETLLLEACLAAKLRFVVDNTNVTTSERARYIASAKAAHFRVVGYYFRSSLAAALCRNAPRTVGKVVPERGVSAKHRLLQAPSLAEGFDEIHLVTLAEDGEYDVRELHDEL